MSDDVEICVVGGGPAGATLAARLAGLGHDVLVVERHRFPRAHVGESLSPAIWPLLELLGVRDEVARAGFGPSEVARVRWRGGEEERVHVPHGLTVERGAFDAILLDRARDAGARVLAPAAAQRPVREGHGWRLVAGERVLRARFVADASGRRRLLGGGRATGVRTVALHARWRAGPLCDGTQTRIEALADGWLWGARLPGGAFRAMAFVDPQTLLGGRRARRGVYERLLADSRLFAELPRRARIDRDVQACGATTYAVRDPIDATSVRVGESAFAIDPLSASGVQTAIQTGLAAAACVHSILASEGATAAAIAYYAEQQRHAVRRHAATAAGLYAEHAPHAAAPFWARRAATAPAAPPVRAAPLAELLRRPVRLPASAAVRETPCLVGDRIELRRALTHPDLDRAVAFLAGHEIAPLLDALEGAPSLAQAIGCWDAALGRGEGAAVARWLHARGLLATG